MYDFSEDMVLALNLGNKSAMSILDGGDRANWIPGNENIYWFTFFMSSYDITIEKKNGIVKIPFSNSDFTQISNNNPTKIVLNGTILGNIPISYNIMDTINMGTKKVSIITPKFCLYGTMILSSMPNRKNHMNMAKLEATIYIDSLYYWVDGYLLRSGSRIENTSYTVAVEVIEDTPLVMSLESGLSPEKSFTEDNALVFSIAIDDGHQENFTTTEDTSIILGLLVTVPHTSSVSPIAEDTPISLSLTYMLPSTITASEITEYNTVYCNITVQQE